MCGFLIILLFLLKLKPLPFGYCFGFFRSMCCDAYFPPFDGSFVHCRSICYDAYFPPFDGSFVRCRSMCCDAYFPSWAHVASSLNFGSFITSN